MRSWNKTFVIKNDSVCQILLCNNPNDESIKFSIGIEHFKSCKHINIYGAAFKRNSIDGETDEDENRDRFFCQDYYYDDNLKIRLDEEGNKARINSKDNPDISNELMKLK